MTRCLLPFPVLQDLFGLPPATEAELKEALQTVQSFLRQTLHQTVDWSTMATAKLGSGPPPTLPKVTEKVDMEMAQDVQFWIKVEALLNTGTGAITTDAAFAKWMVSCLPSA